MESFFCLRFLFTTFYTGSFQVPPEKNHPHLKCQFSPKIPIWPTSLLYKSSEKWLSHPPPVPPRPISQVAKGGEANYEAESTLEPPRDFEFESCVVDIDILIKFRNGYRKIMQSIRIKSTPHVTLCVMLRNNFQMLKRNCWKAKKDFPLYRFVGCSISYEFKNNLSFNLLVFWYREFPLKL